MGFPAMRTGLATAAFGVEAVLSEAFFSSASAASFSSSFCLAIAAAFSSSMAWRIAACSAGSAAWINVVKATGYWKMLVLFFEGYSEKRSIKFGDSSNAKGFVFYS